ncbi:MAG TPA: hypothetical protein VLW26_07480 [Steroidobacteraceae bacterium]|nr:hypothetical protein [Steroidobacteraceae bacterium]
MRSRTVSAALLLALAGAMPAASWADGIDCTLQFSTRGWAAFYQSASGSGTIKCSNGASLAVTLTGKGGGLTVGKSVESGTGRFSSVHSIEELLGTYVAAQAQAGAVKSTQAQAMTKGEVSLALHARGEGWELGVSFGTLKIERR